MISSKSILTVAPEYEPPKGGIAQCVASYANSLFCDDVGGITEEFLRQKALAIDQLR